MKKIVLKIYVKIIEEINKKSFLFYFILHIDIDYKYIK